MYGLKHGFYRYLVLIWRGGALVETMPFDQRVQVKSKSFNRIRDKNSADTAATEFVT